MSERIRTVAFMLSIHDAEQLRLAAEARALENGIAPVDWRRRRAEGDEVGNDALMLYSPGYSLPGTWIVESSCD